MAMPGNFREWNLHFCDETGVSCDLSHANANDCLYSGIPNTRFAWGPDLRDKPPLIFLKENEKFLLFWLSVIFEVRVLLF